MDEPTNQPKRPRGRPRKTPAPVETSLVSPVTSQATRETLVQPPPTAAAPLTQGTTPPYPATWPQWDPLEEIIWTLGAACEDDADTRPEITIGRAQAIAAVKNFVARGRHVLIVGARGTGKSHLLRHTARELLPEATGENYLWLDDFRAPRSILIDLCLELHEAGHLSRYQEESDPDRVHAALNRLRLGELTDIIAASLRGRGYVVCIDNLETLTPSGVPTLQAITENATVVATCKLDQLERVQAVVDRFNRVELGPMPDDEIRALLWTHLDQATVADPKMLERRVIAQANGIPGVAVDASHKLAGSASLADIRSVQSSTPTSSRIDATWIIFFAVGGLIAMRYVARATDSATAYVAFGILSAFGMIARALLPRLARSGS